MVGFVCLTMLVCILGLYFAATSVLVVERVLREGYLRALEVKEDPSACYICTT